MGYRRVRVSPFEEAVRRAEIEAEHQRRRRSQIEAMVADLDRRAADLEREIIAEQNRAGIHDPTHFAYPTYAKSVIIRRDNLRRSADELRAQLDRTALMVSSTLIKGRPQVAPGGLSSTANGSVKARPQFTSLA